jgi:hypothetical protein
LYNKAQTTLVTYPSGKTSASFAIPNSVTSIASDAFLSCSNLAAIEVEGSNTAYSSVEGILYNKPQTALHTYPAGKTGVSFTIPDGVTGIWNYAFSGCSLAEVTIRNSVTSIGGSAFYSCSSLASVTIGNSVTSIAGNAFYSCSSLAEVTFEGPIASSSFNTSAFYGLGDLRAKFYATDASNGTPGRYTTTAPVGNSSVWTKTN